MNASVIIFFFSFSFFKISFFKKKQQQGDNSAEIAEAQHKLKAVQVAFDAADARAREAKVSCFLVKPLYSYTEI